MVTNNQQAFTLGDGKFVGIDTYNSPNKLQEGYFQKLDNVQIYGNTLQPRNGWNACWNGTSGSANYALGNPIWETVALKDNGQQSKIVFTCNGKLYYWDSSTYNTPGNQPVEILDRTTGTSFAFTNSENVRMVSYGQYIYGAAGGSYPLFRVRMNDNVVEGESLPVLVDITPYSPVATANAIIIRAISNQNKTAIDTTSFGSAPSTVATLLTNGNFSSSTATGFGQWNYNTTDVQYITSTTKTVGGQTYKVFSTTAKNPDNYILTRDNNVGNCLKIDQAQDFFFQDVDVRSVLITKDETPLAFTGLNGSATLTIAAGHNLIVGQIIQFTVAIAGLTTATNYYVKSITTTTLTVTTDSTLAAAAVLLTANITSGQTYIIPQHNAGLYCLTFYAYNQDDLTNFVSQNNLDVTIQGYWKTATTAFSSSNEITGATVYTNVEVAAGQSSADWQKIQLLIDFRSFDKILTGLKIRVQAAFNRGGDSFVYLDDFYLHALNSRFQIADSQDDPKGLVKINANQANSTFLTDVTPSNPFVDYVQNEYTKINISPTVDFTAALNQPLIVTSSPHGLNVGNTILFTTTVGGTSTTTTYYVQTISSPTQFIVTTDQTLQGAKFVFSAGVTTGTNYYQVTQDLRNIQSISVQAAFSEKINQSVPPFSLGIRNGNNMYFTGQCSYDKDHGYLTWQLFPILPDVRTQVAAIYIKNDFDLNGFYNNEWVISFGNVVRQGALTPGSKYTYTFSLWRPYTLPTTTSTPSWASLNFTASTGTPTIITTAVPHYLGVGCSLTFTGTTGGVSTTTTYYVKSVPSSTTFTITTDITLQGAAFSFTANVTSGANQYTPLPEIPSGNGFETAPSKLSNEVIVTAAINSVSLAIPYTATQLKQGLTGSTPVYKYCLIYRNNVLSGGNQPKLIGFIDLDTGSAYSSGSIWKGLTTSSSGVTTNLTITDQVEDSALFFDNGPGTLGYRLRTGKDQFPTGCDVVSVYNMRLFASKRNAIYASWALIPGNEYGIYTTLLPDVTDPEVAIKGTQFSISNKTDEEQIQAMAAVQGDGLMRDNSTSAAMVIMRERSTYLLTGDSPHNFASQGFLQHGTAGLLAKRGYATVMSKLVYLTASGLMELQSTTLVPKSLALEGVLNINSQNFTAQNNNYISPALYSKVVLATQDRRLLMLAPTQTDTVSTANSRMYIFDSRNQGWYTWINPYPFTSLVVLESSDDAQEVYAGDRNGRLYKLEGWTDAMYTSVNNASRSTTTPISWEIKTRQYGQTFAEGSMYYSANKLHNLLLHVNNQSTSSVFINWAMTGNKGYSTTGLYEWPSNTNKVLAIRSVSRTADQQAFDIDLTGTTSTQWSMFAIHAQTTEGNTPRS